MQLNRLATNDDCRYFIGVSHAKQLLESLDIDDTRLSDMLHAVYAVKELVYSIKSLKKIRNLKNFIYIESNRCSNIVDGARGIFILSACDVYKTDVI